MDERTGDEPPCTKKDGGFPVCYFLPAANTASTAPNPARIPATGAGEVPACAAGFASNGFTCGTSGVSVTVGAGVGVAVGVGAAVSQMEDPCGVLEPLLLVGCGVGFSSGTAYTTANGLKPSVVTS